MILGDSTKIPYASEQGTFSAEQGINVPCSAENRDIWRLTRRLPDAFPAESAACRKDGGARDCDVAPRSGRPCLNLQVQGSSSDMSRSSEAVY
jgi:hypothetical protein